jgi:hypothetical protein
MQEQEKAGKARMIGYGIGILAAAVVVIFKLIFR